MLAAISVLQAEPACCFLVMRWGIGFTICFRFFFSPCFNLSVSEDSVRKINSVKEDRGFKDENFLGNKKDHT